MIKEDKKMGLLGIFGRNRGEKKFNSLTEINYRRIKEPVVVIYIFDDKIVARVFESADGYKLTDSYVEYATLSLARIDMTNADFIYPISASKAVASGNAIIARKRKKRTKAS